MTAIAPFAECVRWNAAVSIVGRILCLIQHEEFCCSLAGCQPWTIIFFLM